MKVKRIKIEKEDGVRVEIWERELGEQYQKKHATLSPEDLNKLIGRKNEVSIRN